MSELKELLAQSDPLDREPGNVADGLFAIAAAIDGLASAIYETAGGPWPKVLAEALKEAER